MRNSNDGSLPPARQISIFFDGIIVWISCSDVVKPGTTALKILLGDPPLVTVMQDTNMWNRDDFAHTLYGS